MYALTSFTLIEGVNMNINFTIREDIEPSLKGTFVLIKVKAEEVLKVKINY